MGRRALAFHLMLVHGWGLVIAQADEEFLRRLHDLEHRLLVVEHKEDK